MDNKGTYIEIDTLDDGCIRLKKVFNPVVFETDDGKILTVSMKDNKYEIGLGKKDIDQLTLFKTEGIENITIL